MHVEGFFSGLSRRSHRCQRSTRIACDWLHNIIAEEPPSAKSDRWERAARVPTTLTTSDYRCPSMKAVSCALGKAPTLVATSWPPLKSIKVGIPRMPKRAGTCWISSTFIFATSRR